MLTEFLLNILPSMAGIILALAYIPQIKHLYKEKHSTGISVWFWIILCVALAMLLTNATVIFVMYGTWGYMLTEMVNLGLALVILFMTIYYKRGKKLK